VSKLIDRSILVHSDKGAAIADFICRRRLYRVEAITSCWQEPSEWWDGKPVRTFVRVDATNVSTGTCELCNLGRSGFSTDSLVEA